MLRTAGLKKNIQLHPTNKKTLSCSYSWQQQAACPWNSTWQAIHLRRITFC